MIPLFKREQRSLFGEILDWMLTPLLLVWPLSLMLTWVIAQGIANKPFDRALEYNAQTLAQLVTVRDKTITLNLPQPAREILRADTSDVIYYQVLGVRGELVAGERDLPQPPADEVPVATEVRMRDAELRGTDIRIAYTWVRLELSGTRLALVQVAETREKRSVLATEIVKGLMLPQFVILPLAVALVWLALERGIKPLQQLEDRIRSRRADDLSALDLQEVPLEVQPVVSSVNDLLERLKGSIATQKRFLADAAHQLKTPLAGLRMQADLALREGASADELKRSLLQIGRSSVRATHTVNQLLALAQAEGGSVGIARQTCDLAQITMDALRDSVPRALDKGLDMGYDGAQPGSVGVQMQGNPTLLREMVNNLLDNAINYTPAGPGVAGVITARLLVDQFGQVTVLQVEDTGPGIAPAERDLVFQPFYRVLGSEADGSGLGLPIVREIAGLHQGRVTLEDASPGQHPPGTRVVVRFDIAANATA